MVYWSIIMTIFSERNDMSVTINSFSRKETEDMAFFNSAVTVLQILVIALGAGLGVWGVVNLLEGYGNDNPGAKSQGMKHVIPDLLEQ